MSRHASTRPARTHRPWLVAGLILLGAILSSEGADALSRNSTSGTDVAVVGGPTIQTVHSITPVTPVTPAADPVRLRIPSIGVDTALQSLGLLPNGSLEAPSQWQVAGWFRGGVRPGNPGPAVIAGHIDSRTGPAVFYRLRELHVGDAVLVSRADRSVVKFVVDDIAAYRRDTFPAAMVYGPQPVPVLRLITCTGDFDRSTGNYLDNLVVSAQLA